MTPGKSISLLVGHRPRGARGPLLHPVPPLLDARLRLPPAPPPTVHGAADRAGSRRATCGDRLDGRDGDNVDPRGLHGGGQVLGRAAPRPAARTLLRGDRRHDHGRGGPLDPGDLRRARARPTSARSRTRSCGCSRSSAGDVIATGGGLPCRDGRPEALRALGTVVWLSRRLRHALRARAARRRRGRCSPGRTRDEVEALYARASPSTPGATSRWTPPGSTPTRSAAPLVRRVRALAAGASGRARAVAVTMPRRSSTRLAERPLLGDGAMGTMLYARGVPLDACFDVLNLNDPKIVQCIHAEYIAAGADCIETNTFGANRFKLGHARARGRGARDQPARAPGWRATCARRMGRDVLRARLHRPARQVPGAARHARAGRRRAPRSASRRRGCSRAAWTPSSSRPSRTSSRCGWRWRPSAPLDRPADRRPGGVHRRRRDVPRPRRRPRWRATLRALPVQAIGRQLLGGLERALRRPGADAARGGRPAAWSIQPNAGLPSRHGRAARSTSRRRRTWPTTPRG